MAAIGTCGTYTFGRATGVSDKFCCISRMIAAKKSSSSAALVSSGFEVAAG